MKLVVEVHDSVIQNAQYRKLPTEAKFVLILIDLFARGIKEGVIRRTLLNAEKYCSFYLLRYAVFIASTIVNEAELAAYRAAEKAVKREKANGKIRSFVIRAFGIYSKITPKFPLIRSVFIRYLIKTPLKYLPLHDSTVSTAIAISTRNNQRVRKKDPALPHLLPPTNLIFISWKSKSINSGA